MVKKNVKFILTRHHEAHPHSRHPEAHPLSRHPEERSDVRVSGRVGSVVGSQDPHALQAQDDVSCFRHPEAHPPSLCHPEERSDVRVSGQVGTVVVSRGPHALQAQDDKERKKGSGRRASGEQGRSMVEMLGTLAIMGVLSVGAVAGYRYAITKYQANETFNELKRRVVIHSQQAMVGAALDQTEMGEYTSLGYPIDVYDTGKGSFELFLQDMDKDLCDALIKANWTLPIQTRVNDLLGGSCKEEGNAIAFQFQTTMSGCTSDDDCLCGTCVNGKCESSCPTSEVCAKSFEDGTYDCHPVDSLVDNTHCDYPNPNGDGTCCDENGENCCPPDKPLVDKNGKCYSCEDTNNIQISWFDTPKKEICDRCPKRVYIEGAWAYHTCAPACPPEKPVMDDKGGCHTCDEEVDYINVHGIVETCQQCVGTRVLASGGKQGVDNWTKYCWRCDVDIQSIYAGVTATQMSRDMCTGCTNRILVNNNYCAKPCTDSNTFMSTKGECYTCQEPDIISTYGVQPGSSPYNDASECQKCWGKRFLGSFRHSDSNGTGDVNLATACYSCDTDIQWVRVGTHSGSDYPDMCNACGNRIFIGSYSSNNGYCAKLCTGQNTLSTEGNCMLCSDDNDFSVKGVPVDYKCNCPGVRYLDGDTCKKCPTDTSALTAEQQAQCASERG